MNTNTYRFFISFILLFVLCCTNVFADKILNYDKEVNTEKEINVGKEIDVEKEINASKEINVSNEIVISYDDPSKYAAYKDYPHLKKSFSEYYDDWVESESEQSFEDYLKQQRKSENIETLWEVVDTADNIMLVATIFPGPDVSAVFGKMGTTVLKKTIKKIMRQTAANLKNSKSVKNVYYKAFKATSSKGTKVNLNGTVKAFSIKAKDKITKKSYNKIIMEIAVSNKTGIIKNTPVKIIEKSVREIKSKAGKPIGTLTEKGKFLNPKGEFVGYVVPKGINPENAKYIVNKKGKFIYYIDENGKTISDFNQIKNKFKPFSRKHHLIETEENRLLENEGLVFRANGEYIGKTFKAKSRTYILAAGGKVLSEDLEEVGKLSVGFIKDKETGKIIAYMAEDGEILTSHWFWGYRTIKKRIKKEWEKVAYKIKGSESELVLDRKGDGQILAENMEKLYGFKKPKYSSAHHLVPANTKVGDIGNLSREVLERFGININDPRNGVFLPTDNFRAKALKLHNHMHGSNEIDVFHGKKTLQFLDEQLGRCQSKEQVFEVLKDYREAILNNNFFWLK